MNLPEVETLLLQEMENVKGGTEGTCECSSGAGQSSTGGGKCICDSGAGQLAQTPEIIRCVCKAGASQLL